MLVDANTVGTPQEGNPQNLHWLANGAQVVDGTLSLDSATVIRAYAGPGPAEGSGSHRYVFVLYAQGDNFTAPVGFTETINEVPSFSLASYVSAAGFESPVAANYFNVQNGEATASVELTQPVNSATLSATATASASASAITAAPSASGSAGSSAGASASGSHAHSSSTSASSSNAPASAKTDSAATNVLPALGLALAAAAASIFAF
jgi:hypothetical protein